MEDQSVEQSVTVTTGGDDINRPAGCQNGMGDGGSPGQAPGGGPPQEHDVSIPCRDDGTALKERDKRRDCDPETAMYQTPEDRFRSSNRRNNWEDTSQDNYIYKSKQIHREESEMPSSFPAMPLETTSQIERSAVPGQGGVTSTVQQTGCAISQTGTSDTQQNTQQQSQQSQQTQTQLLTQAQAQPQPLLQPRQQPQLQSQLQPQPQRQTRSQPEPLSESQPLANSQQSNPQEPPAVSGDNTKPGEESGSGKEKRLDTNEIDREPQKTESKSTENLEVRNDEQKRETDASPPCTSPVSFLLDHSKDTPDIVRIKEQIIHEMSPAQTRSTKMKTAYGLAVSLLKLEDWQIKKLLYAHIPDCDIHDTGVRNILKELTTERKTIGDIVLYFTLDHSKRLDLVDLLLQIHKGCPHCNSIHSSVR